MANNPEIAHVLNDPSVLRQSLASASNPQLMREQMRNTDRAMSNLEAHPGGHNMLRRMYETIQAPLYDASAQPASAGQGHNDGDAAQTTEQAQAQAGPNTSALPNPWSRPPTGGGPWGGGFGGFM